ncbi:MAG: heavy metal translocating P-type ATPase metal-binding domain-containing protein [Candidatus Kapabacteria bacterium]|nr:heavy metal translocating P-type ATPase metal-binding domain-containing protein [Candidatus Kapabacteria bacterium]
MKHETDLLHCYHCGESCPDNTINKIDKYFCCTGCLYVYELLNDNKLDSYYKLNEKSGIRAKTLNKDEFAFLDNIEIEEKLLKFKSGHTSKVILYLPQIYCSACVWLLENISRLDHGIIDSKINFLKKELSILYRHDQTSLRKLVELLTMLGYTPTLNLADIGEKKQVKYNRQLYLKLGLAGFAFGNIMLFSFPEYLSFGLLESNFRIFLSYLSLIMSPLILYASGDYFKSAYNAIKMKHINLDIPLAAGIGMLFVRSLIEIVSHSGVGFMDSMSGLVFFLLTGKVFQQKTFHTLSFERDFKSYFPLSVLRKRDGKDEYIPVKDIKEHDVLIIRNNEIVPVDAHLIAGDALIDYSFVTGESAATRVGADEKIFSGGKQVGSTIELKVLKNFDQSYITELWNNSAFVKIKETNISKISDLAGKYFSYAILIISVVAFLFWAPTNLNTAINIFTAVLIIACPCAIALTIPYTYGMTLRIMGKNMFFLRNDKVVENLSRINTVILDKTGTLTDPGKSTIFYKGKEFSKSMECAIKSLTRNSTHPLSRIISESLTGDLVEIRDYQEISGKGIFGRFDNYFIKLGSLKFVEWDAKTGANEEIKKAADKETNVFLSINEKIYGYFGVQSSYREGLSLVVENLKKFYNVEILSGDNDSEKAVLEQMFPGVKVNFNQLPDNKIRYIESLQSHGDKVLMIGDGLNDAGALKQADVGIAVAELNSNFTPGSDAILQAKHISKLPEFLLLTTKAITTVYLSYGISLIYNCVGLYFAVTGKLAPVVAAILMPLSSLSVVLFTIIKVKIDAKFHRL